MKRIAIATCVAATAALRVRRPASRTSTPSARSTSRRRCGSRARSSRTCRAVPRDDPARRSGADGEEQRWTVEGPFPGRLERYHLARDFLKAGDVIEACGFVPKPNAERSFPPPRFIDQRPLAHAGWADAALGAIGKLDNCVRPTDSKERWLSSWKPDGRDLGATTMWPCFRRARSRRSRSSMTSNGELKPLPFGLIADAAVAGAGRARSRRGRGSSCSFVSRFGEPGVHV